MKKLTKIVLGGTLALSSIQTGNFIYKLYAVDRDFWAPKEEEIRRTNMPQLLSTNLALQTRLQIPYEQPGNRKF